MALIAPLPAAAQYRTDDDRPPPFAQPRREQPPPGPRVMPPGQFRDHQDETMIRPGSAALGRQQTTPQQRRALANHNADIALPVGREQVQQITEAWSIQTEANVSHAALFDRGRVYFADWSGHVYCINAEDGKEVWKKQIGQPDNEQPWHGFVGTGALGDGLLFQASAEGKAYAIDMENGEVVWEQELTEQDNAGNTGKLLYHNGMLFIGLASTEEYLAGKEENFEPTFRGRVLALDGRSGEIVWSASLVREPSNGVPVWGGFALDTEQELLYFTTGNNFTGEASSLSNSIIAVDAWSGDLVWARQTTPHDVWAHGRPQGPRYAFMTAPQLFNAYVDDRPRRLVGAGSLSGVYHVFDRYTGEPVWTTTVGYGNIGGGIHAEASIGRGAILVCGNNGFAYENADQHPLDVRSVNATTGGYNWVKPRAQPAQLNTAGFLAGEVYFVGSLDGRIRAYNAEDGEELWTSEAHAPIASSLKVEENLLCFGTGVPAEFGGGAGGEAGKRGLFAYRIGDTPVRGPAAGATGRDRLERGRAPRAPGQQGPESGGREIRVTAQGTRFEPSEIRVRPGERVRILLVNRGSERHSIAFELPSAEARLEPIAAGAQEQLAFAAPDEPGRYTFYCPVGDHREKGMTGTLIVEEGDGRGPRGGRQQR